MSPDCTQYNNKSNPLYFSIEQLLIRKCQEVSVPGTNEREPRNGTGTCKARRMVLFAHLLAGLRLPPGVGEAGPPGPVGGQHEAAEDEEGEDLLEPRPPRPQHEADQRDQQRQAQEHVNIPDNGQTHETL